MAKFEKGQSPWNKGMSGFMAGRKFSAEHRRKIGLANSGSRGGNWRGGRTVVLNADHIKPFASFPELRLEVSNGRTLCEDCHRKQPTQGRPRKADSLQAGAG